MSQTISPSAQQEAGPLPLRSRRGGALAGTVRVPGDKSISHRSLMLGGLAVGRTEVTGLLEGEDVVATAKAMTAMGAKVERIADGAPDGGPLWRIDGVGVGGLMEPADVLDMGNAGTGARLLMGLLATHDLTAVMTGDGSLRKRPMKRVTEPLSLFGARFMGRSGARLPMAIQGGAEPVPITYRVPMASAQVKSAVLLAGLNTPGKTTVIEPTPTRDHTERMLRHFGADLRVEDGDGGETVITLVGQPELIGGSIVVPADPSSAAFPLVAAVLVPDSHITLTGVGMNPQRIGLIETLREMGADILIRSPREEAGEPVADLEVRAAPLTGIEVPASRAPSMIDEYPILAVAASMARGETRMHGLGELRVKESDRLTAMAEGLAACGVSVEVDGDTLIVHGKSEPPMGGATVPVNLDHRIGMSFLVLGLITEEPVTIDDGRAIDTSFPGFAALMASLGATVDYVR
ncbi:MAG: 3-phosphoshikimate 1-carboxyvinyltransferase [Rhodospirillum sp.]|nr:3-phosphoshikimate 1-carboxyvinyltransferase [Rhodospirillum sp.]MCF8490470.1 3-phosphoshikimate 1-carboxyvinyltransferase [Rhodospirillum sp.]MCF8500833.1 3-phosphoshikimate 1-carboxyvinyltransferase [Rhodospirillum sp.]